MKTIYFESIFSEEMIDESMKDLESKRDSCGIDGVYLSELREYWDINGRRIRDSIIKGEYTPGTVREIEIFNYKGKRRTIALYNSIDRLILRCLAQRIQKDYDYIFTDDCYAYREGFGVEAAVKQVTDYLNEDYIYWIKIDIKNYYDNISIVEMERIINEYIEDSSTKKLIIKYLHTEIECENGTFRHKNKGIVQGNPISPFLSNLYLSSFDNQMQAMGYRYCRFGDDICIFFNDREKAEKAYGDVIKTLKTEFKLDINKNKSGIYEGINQKYLGYSFIKTKKNIILAIKNDKNKYNQNYNTWIRDVVKKVDRDYHIINDGILTKKDYNILFENETEKKYIPVETSRAINVHSNIMFSSDFFKFIAAKRLDVNMFDKYGNYIGCFVTSTNGYKGKTMLKQAEVYMDNSRRVMVAKAMEIGAIHNIRANLRYYYKHNKTESLYDAIKKMSSYIKEINDSNSLECIMLVEARARELYYKMFNEIIKDNDFKFTTRTRRPPKDGLNALISFGNVYLYNRVATEINKTTLDIRIGFVHSVTNRNQSLNLDIADIFKPIIVDRTIFSIINLKMINYEKHFVKNEDGSIYLSSDGKRLFLNALSKKIYSKQTDNNHPINYETRIRNEISKVYRYVKYNEKYKPYKYQ